MPRKKKETDVPDNRNGEATAVAAELPVAIPVDVPIQAAPVAEETAVVTGRLAPSGQQGSGPKRPVASFRTNSDRGTSLEVSVWSNTHKAADGTEFEQLSVTVQRSYKDANGQWCRGGSYRIHDLPILLFLLQKAYTMALDRRTDDSSLPF